jgi:cytochrome c oxidase assembly factor CtaG
LISGLYKYLTKPFYPPHYHAVIGVKFLFVLHVFAASVLYTLPNLTEAKRRQRLNWLVISGLVIVAISAYLRFMTLNAMQLK